MPKEISQLLTELEYAELRRCSPRTVQRERETGAGCTYLKIGRLIRYRDSDIARFLEEHVTHSTSEAGARRV